MDASFQCLRAIEVPKEYLTIVRELGEGQFGKVFQGSLRSPMSGTVSKVAIKMLTKVEHSAQDHFFLEAMTMRKFSHPHIIKLLGVVSQAQPISLIMEIAEYGELRSFLQQNQMKLQLDNLLLYCYQIANALEYLASKQVVHRDIAARNCLVFSFDLVKLADFGLSRLMQDHNYYKARSKGKMPIKWMSPESIFYRRFTSASDVWMFGVCCWEVFMFGVKPYQGMKNQKIVECIERGQKLSRPNTCPKNVYTILEQCWAMKEFERPTFSALNQRFRSLYEQYSGTSVEKLPGSFANKPGSPKNSVNDQKMAEKEFEMLRERLENSLQQSIDDSQVLMMQEKSFVPFKASTGQNGNANNKNFDSKQVNKKQSEPLKSDQNLGQTYDNLSFNQSSPNQATVTSSIGTGINNSASNHSKISSSSSSMRIGSGDSATFLVTSNSSRSSLEKQPENESILTFRKELESICVEIYHLIYTICSNLSANSSEIKTQNQSLVFEVGSKIRQFNNFVTSKVSVLTPNQESHVIATMCCRILESDAQELIRGFRLSQQKVVNQSRELLIASNILSVNLKNTIKRVCSLISQTQGNRIISHSSV